MAVQLVARLDTRPDFAPYTSDRLTGNLQIPGLVIPEVYRETTQALSSIY